jgi:FtsZ-binding cell division protein ZapB
MITDEFLTELEAKAKRHADTASIFINPKELAELIEEIRRLKNTAPTKYAANELEQKVYEPLLYPIMERVYAKTIEHLREDAASLQRENQAFREVLGFYADKDRYLVTFYPAVYQAIAADGGELACEALSKYPSAKAQEREEK